MGTNHAKMGAVIALPLGGMAYGLPPWQLALFTAMTAGASVINDLDHPDSAVANCMGPISRALAWVICKISGGHRKGTHSLLGVSLFSLTGFSVAALFLGSWNLLWIGLAATVTLAAAGWSTATFLNQGKRPRRAFKRRWYGWASAATLIVAGGGAALAATVWGRIFGGVLVFVLVVLCLSALLRAWYPVARLLNRLPGRIADELLPYAVAALVVQNPASVLVLPYALTLGVAVHILGDMATVQGCPLGFPWSLKAVRLPITFVTDSPEEKILGVAMIVAFGGLAFVQVWPYIELLATYRR